MLSTDASMGAMIGAREGPSRRGRSRLWFWVVAGGVVLALIFALAFYLPALLSHQVGEGVPLIKADPRPFKLQPDNPGGATVPHQDIEIYQRIGNAGAAAPQPKVERLLPPPEVPMAKPEPLPPAAAAPPPAPVPVAPPTVAPGAGSPAAAVPPVATAPAGAPAATAPPVAPPAQAAIAPPPAAAAPAAPPASAAPPAPPAAAEDGGKPGYRVQVGAVHSVDQASSETARLRRTYAELLGSVNMNVVRAQLPSGVSVFRLQAGPMKEAQARGLCDKLKERKLGCLVLKP